MNDAIRSNQTKRLQEATEPTARILPWNLRIEPAFARAIDFVVGERFAEWTRGGGRASLQLTAAGIAAASAVEKISDALEEEKAIIAEYAKKLTEQRVSTLIGEGLTA
ncbi:hypothetical protein [Azospirillum ramasamyi]|uniref:hypothetical protein n=1 Tax=Azospirillum ramasamyi TaxID=682998 RepID=UPI0013A69C8D|nr:hypothetical protein [Azospirillum ramasamyi]